jgi:hypothetical protein
LNLQLIQKIQNSKHSNSNNHREFKLFVHLHILMPWNMVQMEIPLIEPDKTSELKQNLDKKGVH